MRIFRDFKGLPAEARGAAVALGNFDGVHRGHAAVIAAAADAARAHGLPLAALTFEPHPREVFRPRDPPFRLTLAAAKAEALAALGIDLLYELPFDEAFSRIAAEAFITEVLAEALGARHVACGPDFHFGHRRTGTPALLATLGPAHGIGVTVVPEATDETGGELSSTAVRDALRAGDLARAEAILGRPWEIRGRVERGAALGRTLGFPTANVPLGRHLVPRLGIYAVEAATDGRSWLPGVASLGVRPTVNTLASPLLEVHLFDVAPDLYERELRVRLRAFLRDEAQFPDLEALVRQMRRDAEAARAVLRADAR
ncbi:MAG: bifunctional riboflavin kinase/FAD synthetase [Elioraea sp.]|nr:bifunctional riboflavin kinase/FAD synthetase [Elioraea sp.]